MIAVPVRPDRTAASPLGRASPLATLVVAAAWLAALATTLDPRPPVLVAGAAIGAALALGRVAPRDLARGLAPLWLAALSVGLFNALLSPANADPAAATALSVGPLRITEPALAAGLALGLRVVAIVAVGVGWSRVTDPTHLTDALVQQARLPDRFAYGALAALQAIPWLAEDLVALREARRMRGLRATWHPRVLVGLLVLAVRRADRLAVAMDARGFAAAGRTRYRIVRWLPLDGAVLAGGLVVLAGIVALR
ncbi:MAG TPA: energy-coupling factor transporter transmembrane component T [Candidatus Nanopelagicales bacterium]|nr:energy-coupling factor transporter transmembrane component T [Candidatus Nanopelagicales bacterium]